MKTLALAAALLALASPAPAASVPSPSELLGIGVGADRTVADYRQVLAYFKALDAASARVEVEILGKTTLGEDLFLAVISSEANLANKQRLQEVARRIADPRGLDPAEAEALVREGRVHLLVTANIHSTEIGASQMAMEWAHALATAQDEKTRRWLDEVVLLLAPSLNPDGQVMETEWYRKHLGTRYEGGRMPWLYHPYVGHDNNRDWFMLTQKEIHRRQPHGLPPVVPPGLAGRAPDGRHGAAHVRAALRRAGRPRHPPAGLARRQPDRRQHGLPARAGRQERRDLRHHVRRLLARRHQEHRLVEERGGAAHRGGLGALRHARAHRARTELSGGGKGLVEYKPQVNFPNPWKGGAWRLRDIMDYERIASDALLESCANLKSDLLRNRARMALASIQAGDPADAYRIPAGPARPGRRRAPGGPARRERRGSAELAGAATCTCRCPRRSPWDAS